jgi:TolB-like protein
MPKRLLLVAATFISLTWSARSHAADKVGAAVPASDDLGRPESVEIQVRRLADQLAAGLKDRKGQGRYDRWAVTPFNDLGDEVKRRHMGEVVAEQVEGSLKRDHGFICVERLKLAKIVEEAALAQAGVIDDDKAPKLGELAGADLLVVGSVGLLGDTYVVNVRAVATESAKVVAAASAKFHASGLVALSSDAVVLRTRSDAVFRSLMVPGWGQLYNRQGQKAVTFMFAGGALLAGGIASAAFAAKYQNDYSDGNRSRELCSAAADMPACIGDLRVVGNEHASRANWFFLAYGLLHAYNVLDAYLSGYEPDAASKPLYGGLSLEWLGNGALVRF